MPRWHPAVVDDFNQRIRPANRFVVILQRKRSDLPSSMALDAIRLEDAYHLVAPCHFARRDRLLDAPNQTTDGLCVGDFNRAAIDNRFDRVTQVPMFRARAANSGLVLVVDTAPVTNHKPFIEHEDLRSSLGSKLIGHNIPMILEHREG